MFPVIVYRFITGPNLFLMIRFVITSLLIISLTCCAALRNNQKSDQFFQHKIKYPGETLWLIANWYTGDGKNWKTLQELNTSLRHNRLRIGDTVRIPSSLLKRTSPLPKPKLSPNKNNPSASTTNSVDQAQDADDIWISPPEVDEQQAEPLPIQETKPVVTPTPVPTPPAIPSKKVTAPKEPSSPSRDDLWDEIVSGSGS
ncbi:MAG: LysM peptidoglycan-binding domain-containing protein [Bdellovibrionales bacterium]|nr:LysM peptidoglycan-binding domain-containing protein [Bdellovibrionales bacterium]